MKRAGVFYQLFYHFVWATKQRLPLLTPTVEEAVVSYIRFKCEELGYKLHAINGATDHLHLLVELTPTILVADVAKNLKGASSHFVNKESGLGETVTVSSRCGRPKRRKSRVTLRGKKFIIAPAS